MRFDRDEDWTKSRAEVAARRKEQRIVDLRSTKRSALSAQYVTGDEHWNRLLEVVQERLEAAKIARVKVMDRLESSNDFTAEALINQKLAVRLLGREIETLEWVIGLPKEMIEQGDRATKLLEQYGESAS